MFYLYTSFDEISDRLQLNQFSVKSCSGNILPNYAVKPLFETHFLFPAQNNVRPNCLQIFICLKSRTEKSCEKWLKLAVNTPNNHFFKVNNKNSRKSCEICSKLTINVVLVFINFEHISHLSLVFLLLDLNKKIVAGKTPERRHLVSLSLHGWKLFAVPHADLVSLLLSIPRNSYISTIRVFMQLCERYLLSLMFKNHLFKRINSQRIITISRYNRAH